MLYSSVGPSGDLNNNNSNANANNTNSSTMVSRRKILSRSRDDLNLDDGPGAPQQQQDEEDVWYQKEKLYKVRTGNWPLCVATCRYSIVCGCV